MHSAERGRGEWAVWVGGEGTQRRSGVDGLGGVRVKRRGTGAVPANSPSVAPKLEGGFLDSVGRQPGVGETGGVR